MKNAPLFSEDVELSTNSRRWLMIGVWSLAMAGIFALILVIARTPGFCDMPLFLRLFHEALVVHVDLSVLVWFLSIACMFWSLLTEHCPPVIPFMRRAAQICFIVGMILISLSPLDPNGAGVMSNYIPVIMSPVFFIGLALLLCGTSLMLVHLFVNSFSPAASIFHPVIRYGLLASGTIAIFALAAFIWSFNLLPPQIDGQQFYELGFWGGGHVLQFVHTQILLVCWLLVAIKLKPDFKIPLKLLYVIFSVGMVAAIITPYPYLLFDITSSQHRAFFTDIMISLGGLAPAVLAVLVVPVLWKTRGKRKGSERAIWSALLMSVILFIYGGILAGLIQGQNVVIPAHYHGSIVGVTLAFMAITYLLLPRFKYADVAGSRLAYWQPLVYGFGQLMHISGLAYSGGYGGLQRKTPCGGGVELAPDIKAAMGMMGLGGLLAIIGGLMFVIVVFKAVYGKKSKA